MGADFASFVVLSVVLSVTPGPDTMIVLSNSVAGGTRSGIATTFGVKAGTLTHSVLAAVGVAAVLLQFASFYTVLKLIGAAYLVGLGLFSLARALTTRVAVVAPEENLPRKGLWRCFVEGYLSNILNPKVVVFYVAVLPQFVAPGEPVGPATAKLASVHVGVSFVWLVLVSVFVGSAQQWLTRPSVRRAVNAVSGAAIAAFGVKLALSRQ